MALWWLFCRYWPELTLAVLLCDITYDEERLLWDPRLSTVCKLDECALLLACVSWCRVVVVRPECSELSLRYVF